MIRFRVYFILMFPSSSDGPRIQSFSLDLSAKRMTLILSSAVDHTTFDATRLTLQNTAAAGSTASYTLTSSFILTTFGDPNIVISTEDFAGIALMPNLATTSATTFLSAEGGVLETTDGVPSEPISANSALPVMTFVSDTEQPKLTRFSVNVDKAEVFLFFDEPIDRDTINLAGFSLQDEISDNPRTTYDLAGGQIAMLPDPLSLRISLGATQATALLKQDTSGGLYMSVEDAAFTDYSGNINAEIAPGNPIEWSPFYTTKLGVSTFNLKDEKNRWLLVLNFTKPVSVFTVQPTFITIQGASDISDDPERKYTLTGGASSPIIATIVSIKLNNVDIFNLTHVNITSGFGLETGATNYLSFRRGMIYDIYGNPIEEVLSSRAINVEGQVEDSSSRHVAEACMALIFALLATAIMFT